MKALGLVVSEQTFFVCFSHDAPGALPVWTQGARLAGFIMKSTIHCYTQNIKALGLVVLEKKICLCFSHCKSMGANDPRGGAIFDPKRMVGRIYKEDSYTLLHTKYASSGPCGFGEEDIFMFLPTRPWGGVCMDPRGMVGRIYKDDYYTLLHTKYESSRPCGFREEDFFLCFSHCKSIGAICCHGNQSSNQTWPKT